jgi:hypothetical protein
VCVVREGAMSRVKPFAALIIPILAISALSQGPLSVTIAIYAPKQPNSPAQVQGFKYNDGAIQVVVSNETDKIVTAVAIEGTLTVPPHCSPAKAIPGATGGALQTLRIAPKQTSTTPKEESPLSPPGFISDAHEWQTAFLHVQVGLTEVDFADGTKWRLSENLPVNPFDRGLVQADASACSSFDSMPIVEALQRVSRVAFSSHTAPIVETVSQPPHADVPRLMFTCSLNENTATCPHTD